MRTSFSKWTTIAVAVTGKSLSLLLSGNNLYGIGILGHIRAVRVMSFASPVDPKVAAPGAGGEKGKRLQLDATEDLDRAMPTISSLSSSNLPTSTISSLVQLQEKEGARVEEAQAQAEVSGARTARLPMGCNLSDHGEVCVGVLGGRPENPHVPNGNAIRLWFCVVSTH